MVPVDQWALLLGLATVTLPRTVGQPCPGSTCIACPPGRAPEADSSSCRLCPIGTFSPGGAEKCRRCPVGRVTVTAGSSASDCIACASGMAATADGATCVACPSGRVAVDRGCVQCPPGWRQDAAVCTRCGNGTFSPAGSTSCQQCTPDDPSCQHSCLRQCSFDHRSQRCHLSGEYAADFVGRYGGAPWSEIAAQIVACRAGGAGGAAQCAQLPDCEVDQRGVCTAGRLWAAARLARPRAQGGAALGHRCGVLGQLLQGRAACAAHTDQGSCEDAQGDASGVQCAWDAGRGACDASRGSLRSSLFVLLRRDYHEELTRVGLRREHCAAQTSATACTRECQWSGGRCALRTLGALLAVTGEDCPLRVLLKGHTSCGDIVDQERCGSQTRAGGIPECFWQLGRCEANPMALEFDLLLTSGFDRPEVLSQMRAMHDDCTGRSEPDCYDSCASPSPPPRSHGARTPALHVFVSIWCILQLLHAHLRSS